MTRPELLAPAGSPEAVRAAVQNGADAVYLGWGPFHARGRARGFTEEEFRQALAYCRVRGVRVFLTLNTLLTDRELPLALEQARTACRLGVDAVLVQDWGLFELLRKALPDLPLHASTQMSVFTSGGANLLHEDGCERVVLARECSREDLAAMLERCEAEIEVFVHGALCVCYSGQCAMSAVLGGRSANRGLCAQPCRLPCGADGADSHALSLKDCCLAAQVPEMAAMGVACLKIEGRLKRPEYVAVVTDIYARLLRENRGPTDLEASCLASAFSREGFTDGYWTGRTGPHMFGVRRPAGLPVPPGTPEENGRTFHEELFRRARESYEGGVERRQVPLSFSCEIQANQPAKLTLRDGEGRTVTTSGPVPERARSRGLTGPEVRERLKKTGGTPYRMEEGRVQVEDGLFLAAGAVNALRRDALAAMTAARYDVPERRELDAPELPEADCSAGEPFFTVSVADLSQLTEELLSLGPVRAYVPLEVLEKTASLPDFGGEYCVILPRVWRDRDENGLRRLLERAKGLGITGALVGNIGHFHLLADSGLRLYGDYGLNVCNARSLSYLRDKGLSSACLSLELRREQVRDMKKILPSEAVVYGRLPLMITENRPAGKDGVLIDRTGAAFPLLPAWGGRTEIQNDRPLWLADREDCRRLGLAFARLRFTVETRSECARVYRAYLDGEAARGPFTRGLYDRGV